MARTKRTTKQLAQRIDLNYFKQRHGFRAWRFALSVAAPALALVWLAGYGLARSEKIYSAGGMAPAHAVLAAKCGSCHTEVSVLHRAIAADRACLSCHDGPIHHANQMFQPSCSTCHAEHKGRIRLAAVAEESCAQCHADLHATDGQPRFVRNITDFGSGHPEFAALRFADPGTIKLNHAVHLKSNLAGPQGPVQLACDDCHRPNSPNQTWRFSGGAAMAAGETPSAAAGASFTAARIYGPPSRSMARAYMAPVTYAQQCAGCHALLFDKRFTDSVPHDTPEVVHAFVSKKFEQYIAVHPGELRETSSLVELPGMAAAPSPRVYTPAQWVEARVAEAERLLWGKTCKQCHTLIFDPAAPLPSVAKSNVTTRWFPHAIFDHNQHRLVGCETCHAGARTSQESADVLVPGIRVCRSCHHSGSDGAEARCFECHLYHDWSRENLKAAALQK